AKTFTTDYADFTDKDAPTQKLQTPRSKIQRSPNSNKQPSGLLITPPGGWFLELLWSLDLDAWIFRSGSVEGHFAQDAGQVPAVFVVAHQATQVENNAVNSGE